MIWGVLGSLGIQKCSAGGRVVFAVSVGTVDSTVGISSLLLFSRNISPICFGFRNCSVRNIGDDVYR